MTITSRRHSYDVGAPAVRGDLASRLTARLLRARPLYEPSFDGLPATVEALLGGPFVLTSCGPTSADKHQQRALVTGTGRAAPRAGPQGP